MPSIVLLVLLVIFIAAGVISVNEQLSPRHQHARSRLLLEILSKYLGLENDGPMALPGVVPVAGGMRLVVRYNANKWRYELLLSRRSGNGLCDASELMTIRAFHNVRMYAEDFAREIKRCSGLPAESLQAILGDVRSRQSQVIPAAWESAENVWWLPTPVG